MTSKKSKAQARSERAERAAALVAEAKRKERMRNLLAGGGVVLAMIVIIGGAFLLSRGGANDVDEENVPVAGASTSGDTLGVTIGDADAPHSIVIYEDFLCPFCGQLEAASRVEFAQLAADGKVTVEYRPFNLLGFDGSTFDDSSYSARAANAFAVVAQAGDPEVAKKFHDLLYENQPSESAGSFPDDDSLVDLAVEAGADEAAVGDDITGHAQMDRVEKATTDANGLGINSTPTVLLDGKQFTDFRTIDDLVSNLEDAVE